MFFLVRPIFLLLQFLFFISVLANYCSNPNFQANGPGFSSNDFNTMQAYFHANLNIEGKGGVVASPDKVTPVGGGTYYYDWERDGSLSMRAFMEINNFDPNLINSHMISYIQWVLKVQHIQDPFGYDVRIEPKYNLPNGDVFTGGWGRPQTDGPGLRVSTLCLYAKKLISVGQVDIVKKYLWTNDDNLQSGGAIKYDLDWIVSNWNMKSFDLWEDLESAGLFWNKINLRRGLILGAEIAISMGREELANIYLKVSNDIKLSIDANHWNGDLITEAAERLKDGAVIIGFNEGYADDNYLNPMDVRVASTVSYLNNYFCNSYWINQQDGNNKIPGILYGRYDGDVYQGGNPWVLITAELAKLFYRAAIYVKDKTSSQIDDKGYQIWCKILGISNNGFLPQDNLQDLYKKLIMAGDAVMQRIYYHVSGDHFHLAEQLDKNSGYQSSAKDLTWSYASVLVALKFRQDLNK